MTRGMPPVQRRDSTPTDAAQCTRVVIVADQLLYAELLQHVLHRSGTFQVLGFAQTGAVGVALVQRYQPDLVVMDINAYATRVRGVAQQLLTACPSLLLCILAAADSSVSTSAKVQSELMHMGVRAYLPKSISVNDLTRSLRAVADGATVFVSSTTHLTKDTPTQLLTEREQEIIALVADDLPDKVIALRLSISAKAVEAHLAHIRVKLAARSRAGVVATAYRHGLL